MTNKQPDLENADLENAEKELSKEIFLSHSFFYLMDKLVLAAHFWPVLIWYIEGVDLINKL